MGAVQPAERVRWVVETARAVLDGRVTASEGAVAVRLQRDQTVELLRHDRDRVSRRESEAVATTLRLLAEQVSDQASGLSDPSDHLAIAAALGELAQVLR
jgi:hypothetical protein